MFFFLKKQQLTFALSLVHDLEVRVASAASHQEGTLIFICGTITPTDGMLSGDVGTVWRADALRTATFHPTHFPRAALHPFACLCKKRGIMVGILKIFT